MKKQNKWLDNFGKADNANESNVNMSEDFVGLGYNTKGRKFSPAWGGQFQVGGYIDSVLNANKKLDWVQRLYEENTPSIKIKGQKGKATHFMESSDGRAYPTVVRMADGKLKYLGDDAYDYADKTKTYIQFPSDREAQLFSENYKKGTNVLKDFQRGGKLTPVSPLQQIQQSVQPTPTVPYLQTKDPAEFYKSWIQNPEYERRQLLTGYSEGEDLYMPNAAASRESRLGAIEEMTPITYSARQPSEAKPGVYGSPSYVNINPSDYVGTSKEAIQAHELAHVAGAMGEVRPGMMSATEQDIFKKSMLPMKEPALSGVQGSKEREASVRALEDFKHSQEPDEAKADLDALRFMMYDKGIYDITKGKKFTETDFQKAKQNLGNDRVFKRLENRMGKKNFVKLMNTIALADDQEEAPIAMGGMSIPGSVGFSYARVAGAAPSKGKYAKKTMASAQTGKNNIKKDATNINTGVANKIAGLELQQNPDYQYFKYLQSLPQLRQAPGRGEELMRKGLGYADVATDVMQMGNFIPHPTAQAVGKVGNIAGMIVDGLQGADEAYRGNYLNAGINLASVALPMFLGSNTFRRNAMNLRPGDPLYSLTQKAGKPYTIDLNKTDTGYLELFSKVKGMKDKSLMYNRAFLGGLGAETAYDAGLIGPVKKEYGGEIPSAQNGIMSPMLLARNVLNYFYPSEEAASSVSAEPVNYKKGLTNELLQRQAYKESTFNPSAVSPAGYKGLTQIGEGVLKDYSNKKGGKKLDPFNPEDAVELQKFAMDDLYNASFINKPNQPDSVRIAKTLAAYNWGRGNLANYLNEQKSKGVDIYDSYDWLNNLPKETSDYVNKILLQEDPSFNKNYKKASTNPKYEEVTSLYDQKKFGGDVPSAQKGKNDIEKISINDPRYPEMYKNRQVGLSYDGAISLPDLPEFVVEGKDERMKEAMSQGINKFYAHVGELMGAPQKEAMQLITGKEQTPSEAWGFQDTGGWLDSYSSFGKNLSNFAMDAVLDPVNLLGVGIADDIARTTLKGSSKKLASSANDVSKGFKSEINWAKWNKEIPKNKPLLQEYNAIEQQTKIDGTWMKNPDGTDFNGTPEEFIQQNSSNFKKVYPDGAFTTYKGVSAQGRMDNLRDPDGEWTRPFFAGDKNIADVFTSQYHTSKSPIISHNNKKFNPNANPEVHKFIISKSPNSLRLDAKGGHWAGFEIPENSIPGLGTRTGTPELQRYVRDKGLDYITIDNLLEGGGGAAKGTIHIINPRRNNIPKSAVGNSGMFDMTNPNIYKGVIPAGIATALNIDQQKNGGVTKDNQGYLNPNNFGKVVEIDSNDITMEGVYEPLLGVSDTGDTKLMKPGKNYKFKGKKVTEYPVAKLGINQLDAQPMKKLNQLLNFTNNPDKDNWLDKYN